MTHLLCLGGLIVGVMLILLALLFVLGIFQLAARHDAAIAQALGGVEQD